MKLTKNIETLGDKMKEAIIIFTRVPIPGKTKTRLQSFLTKEQCAQIHKNFLKDIKYTCEKLKRDIFIFYTPEDKDNVLKDIFGYKFKYEIQEGKDLGEKMYKAIEYVLGKKYKSCILIGSDIPFLKEEDLKKAFEILKDKDIVLGPTVDKGYYLVGMKNTTKAVFENIQYGYGNVLDDTIASIKNSNLTYDLTNKNIDIDEKDDLFYFYNEIKKENISKNMNTSKYIIKVIEEYERGCLQLTV
ncbi:MAG: TIGR04282 family arsenosugar biosynthesis glycosyltransferase [Terrisporobacter othiniensis]|uniref:TIGR04282 family arsenosugar biosynthesis glycosyltransferase n=1 Tax=Terrisporobacter petrolearius TaxID=1460447 RepID=UPI0022E0A6A6|nr:TIGR04282 family arsenosugar biosynthesis glycosyltransferase [Terrisporobacter petrolearius]MDU4860488.1 TIGR04282 family arsenosugar biosynthesis glycosyltransferase [Terrisporobacter othiniensis]MDU6993283.1 TIGR04282 family arsenosugar biosynthesis glycosyltransferase [Terrisporobacter othiniensis]